MLIAQARQGRGHFFAAAAEAMRRILVEAARREARDKHGGGWQRTELVADHLLAAEIADPFRILAIHESLELLAAQSPRKAELVKLRFYVGCTLSEPSMPKKSANLSGRFDCNLNCTRALFGVN